VSDHFKVVFTNITGCALGISDIMWSVTVTAGSEAEALEAAIEQAQVVNRHSGMPPHGIQVSEPELRRLASVVPKRLA
jgi:hypothetical protein